MTDLWNDGMQKPTESPLAALRFVAEGLLALGIMVRATVHVVIVSRDLVEHGEDDQEMDVSYALQQGFAVESPAIGSGRELQIRLCSMALGFVIASAWVGRLDFGSPLAIIAVANWGYLTADPLWFATERLFDNHRGQKPMHTDNQRVASANDTSTKSAYNQGGER